MELELELLFVTRASTLVVIVLSEFFASQDMSVKHARVIRIHVTFSKEFEKFLKYFKLVLHTLGNTQSGSAKISVLGNCIH